MKKDMGYQQVQRGFSGRTVNITWILAAVFF